MSGVSALDSPTRPRWWPLIAIVVVVAALLLWTWWDPESDDRQSQVMASEGILSGATLALALWLILLSRVAVRVKAMVAMSVALLIGLFFAGFRYDGVDGDLVPVFTWRWLKVETVVTGEPLSGVAVDWPQFRGVLRNGEVAGVDLADDWDAAPPKLVWRRHVGGGWAGFAVAGERAVTLEQHGDQEHGRRDDARYERPAVAAHFPEGPEQREQHDRAVEPSAEHPPAHQEQTRGQHRPTCRKIIEGAAE